MVKQLFEIVLANIETLSAAPLAMVALLIVGAGIGFASAKFMFRREISTLRTDLDSARTKLAGAEEPRKIALSEPVVGLLNAEVGQAYTLGKQSAGVALPGSPADGSCIRFAVIGDFTTRPISMTALGKETICGSGSFLLNHSGFMEFALEYDAEKSNWDVLLRN